MGETLESDIRLLQIFLSNSIVPGPAVYEVSLKNNKVVCTCATFTGSRSCKHYKFVKNKMAEYSGEYPLELIPSAPVTAYAQATKSNKDYSEIVTMYGVVEVS
jgi:hypothetical protein